MDQDFSIPRIVLVSPVSKIMTNFGTDTERTWSLNSNLLCESKSGENNLPLPNKYSPHLITNTSHVTLKNSYCDDNDNPPPPKNTHHIYLPIKAMSHWTSILKVLLKQYMSLAGPNKVERGITLENKELCFDSWMPPTLTKSKRAISSTWICIIYFPNFKSISE